MNIFRAARRTFVISAITFVALAAAGLANADEYVKTYSVGNRADVRVHADESGIRVITGDTNQVEFRVSSGGIPMALHIGRQIKVDSHQSGDTVELTVKVTSGVVIGLIGPEGRTLKTEVHMPRNADLLVDTHDGEVEVSAVNGNVTIHTRDGSIKASQLAGKIELLSADGAIAAYDVDGKLDASSQEGSVRAEGRFESLNVKSGEGSVAVRALRGSKMQSAWNIETGYGSIRLALPSDLQANLDLGTAEGHITVELPVTMQGYHDKSYLQGTLNGGGPLLTVRSGEGAIRLRGI